MKINSPQDQSKVWSGKYILADYDVQIILTNLGWLVGCV